MMSRSLLSAGLVPLCLVVLGCSGQRTTEDLRAAQLRIDQNDVDGMPQLPEDAVTGYMQKVVDGHVVGLRTLEKPPSAPDDLYGYMASGAPDPNGYIYYSINGAQTLDGVTEFRYNYIGRQPLRTREPNVEKPLGVPAQPATTPVIAPDLQDAISASPDAEVTVYITLAAKLTTTLGGYAKTGLDALDPTWREQDAQARAARIVARKAEAASAQQSVRDLVAYEGGTEQHGLWIVNAMSAKLRLSTIPIIAQHPDVGHIELPTYGGEEDGTWDGTDDKNPGGLNEDVYDANGYNGSAYNGVSGGRRLNIASMGSKLRASHYAFRYPGNTVSRINRYDCVTATDKSCTYTTAAWTSDFSQHQTMVVGLASGSIRAGQITGFDPTEEEARSGVAEGADIYYFWTDGNLAAVNAIETATELGGSAEIDVFHTSWKPSDDGTDCNGNPGANLGAAIHAAQDAGMVFIIGAGDDGSHSGCNIRGIPEAPSALVVGGLQHGCDDTNYGTTSCDIWDTGTTTGSCLGGMAITSGGYTHYNTMSVVGLVAPASPLYGYGIASDIEIITKTNPWFIGCSYANPLVAGSGIAIKDWMLTNNHTGVDNGGALTAMLLGMGDRSNSTTSQLYYGYDRLWGGGRFQLRQIGNLGAPSGWSNVAVTASTFHQTIVNTVGDSGLEPSGIGQFKAYSIWFEDDTSDAADIDLTIMDDNCNGSSLVSDNGFDVHRMARIGSFTPQKALCTEFYVNALPSGQTRDIRAFRYYSGPTTMR